MPTDATTFYLTQGVLGVTVVVLIGVIIWQQRRIDTKDKQIFELQNLRIADSNQYSSTYIAIAKEGVETSKDQATAFNVLQTGVKDLANVVQKLIDKKIR